MPEPIRAVFTNDAFDAAFIYAGRLCSDATHGITEVVILVPAKANMQVSTTIGAYLGEAVVKALGKGQQVTIAGKPAKLMTKQTLTYLSSGTLVICPYASKDIMDKVDSAGQVAGIIALPWSDDAVDQWIKSWSPLVDGKPNAQASKLIDDVVVEQAMKSLSLHVNLSHPLFNARDKEQAIRTLRILRRKKHALDAPAIRAWSVAHGWKPSAADELALLVSKTVALRTTPKVDRLEAAEATYTYWVEQSAK